MQASLDRIRMQLQGMERMIRTLRAEVESQVSSFAPPELAQASLLASGLGTLLAEGAPAAPFAADPYQHFAPGVWIGMDPEVGDSGATVALAALPTGPGNAPRVSRLSVNPVFPLAAKPRWLTLECALDLEALRRARSLRLDMISFFEIGSRNIAQIPRQLTVTLRLQHRDGTRSDHLNRRIPVSTMPFEHSVRVGEAALKDIGFAAAAEAILILELPLAGEFTLHLDHFALQVGES
ncbi:hypothetical protein KM176_05270 [Pseudooceanicola sp. CBS1P-1]|uniref:Uncharacterized protein n=1 Tax=Pseudooceanicola albus TaxID=2692189 RepID=A0A6L7FWC6_9RHOB|nr:MULTISPECIES: hypothetical protein [Pseudooceanicola]MBT9383263.1 hypothetical protein [Pseudooceanicola endophyticus]MXN16414.1 hypothetical protein [Pseudooceanicola albus]